jgi:hypothetical protein
MATRRKKPAAHTCPEGQCPRGDLAAQDLAEEDLAEEELRHPGDPARDPESPNLDPAPAAPAELRHPGGPVPEGLDLNEPKTYDQALRELEIDVPVAACRLVGSRLEFRLYGGRVLYWPPAAGDQPPAARRKKKGK